MDPLTDTYNSLSSEELHSNFLTFAENIYKSAVLIAAIIV
jgi:hypothetical protein